MGVFTISLFIALLVDILLGDPQWRFHPVRLMGNAASFFERVCRRAFRNEYIGGIVIWCAVVTVTMLPALGLLLISRRLGVGAYVAVSTLYIYFAIAPRDLATHASRAAKALIRRDLIEARKWTGYMVSRDVSTLDEKTLTRAVIESTAENVVDGVTAPLIFAALFGPAGALFFRAINTMDAMFGYKNERYLRFGRFSAKADDICGWLPARITGPLFCLSAGFVGGSVSEAFHIMVRDRKRHESPNGGIVEAAAAGALGVQLGGGGVYFGKVIEKPYLGDSRRSSMPEDIGRVIVMMYVTTGLAVVCAAICAFIINHYVLRVF
jgi:adenosylcobinamide-phosphate synthase